MIKLDILFNCVINYEETKIQKMEDQSVKDKQEQIHIKLGGFNLQSNNPGNNTKAIVFMVLIFLLALVVLWKRL